MDFIERCRALIAIDSSPQQGNLRVVDYLAKGATESGFAIDVQTDSSSQVPQANLLVRPVERKGSAQELMLQTHLDTPDPGPFALWKENANNPFDAHIVEGKIFGLGTANCKLDFLCKFEALKRVCDKKPTFRVPPVLVGTYGSETGMEGALRLIRKNLVVTRMALIGEPSDLRILSAGKGIAKVQIRVPYESDELTFREAHNLRESSSTMSKIFQGKASPSSSPQLGESAIKKLFSYLEQLPRDIAIMNIEGGVSFNSVPAHAFLEIDPAPGFQRPMSQKLIHIATFFQNLESEFLRHRDPDFAPDHTTLNIGCIRDHDHYVDLEGDVRIPSAVSNEVYESWIQAANQSCKTVGAEFSVVYYKRPYRTDRNSELIQHASTTLQSLSYPAETGTHSSANEASLFSRTGVECLSFGPGTMDGNIHTPSENVKIDDLRVATDFYTLMIERLCL